MDLLQSLLSGVETAFAPVNLLYCFIGVFLGTVVGVLPGVGPTATVALLLPATFSLDPATGIIMLAGIYYGAQYGGSTTAILLNLPGESSSAVTAIDGYRMAQKGRAGAALATAALGSFFAGTVSTLIIAVAAPALSQLALQFRSVEYFSLILLGLVTSVLLAHGSVVKALAMICLGVLFSLVGQDVATGTPRFTFDFFQLYNGIDFVAVSVGLYGISEILKNLEDKDRRDAMVHALSRLWLTREDFRRIAAPVLRGTALGSFLGILPGGGHVLSSFASYSLEKAVAKKPEEFGQGAIEGVAGPESANNAAAQTSFIPLLTLGLPAHPVMALMIGAFIMQGIVPGPQVISSQPDLFWGLIVSMWVGNLLLVILNLPLIGIWVRLLRIRYDALFPAIVAFSCIGAYSVVSSGFGVFLLGLFGLLGYVLVRLRCELAPLILGFVLGPMLEEHFRRAMMFSRGDPVVFLQSPISVGFLLLSVAALAMMAMPSFRRRRSEIFTQSDD
jgi:putative tricarboxylic transport membrane protein